MVLFRSTIGIRKMVNSQLPSLSIRGRSSVSAISCKNEEGTFKSFSRKSKSSCVGHSTFTQQLGSQLGFSTKPASQKRYFLIALLLSCFVSRREPAKFDLQTLLALQGEVNTIVRSRV